MKKLKTVKELCTGCNICEIVCSLFHTGTVNPAKARLKVTLTHNDFCYPTVCQHCQEPECIAACPAEAIYKNTKTGVAVLNEEKCTSCLACVEACSFHALFVGPNNEVLKCDLCGGDPQCVSYCYPRPESNFPHLPAAEQACLQYVEEIPERKTGGLKK